MMYKHTKHVCFCVNVCSKNRNPLDLGISDSCEMYAVVLESILTVSENSSLNML